MSTPTPIRLPEEQLAIDSADIEADPQFLATRRRQRILILSATTFFMLWYGAYVLVSTFAREFMATPVIGNINIGFLMGFGQFASTVAITGLYIAFTNRKITPAVEELQQQWASKR